MSRAVTADLLLVARACWCLFVASRILQRFLPVTAPSTSTEGDVGHFLAYKRSELAGERGGPRKRVELLHPNAKQGKTALAWPEFSLFRDLLVTPIVGSQDCCSEWQQSPSQG